MSLATHEPSPANQSPIGECMKATSMSAVSHHRVQNIITRVSIIFCVIHIAMVCIGSFHYHNFGMSRRDPFIRLTRQSSVHPFHDDDMTANRCYICTTAGAHLWICDWCIVLIYQRMHWTTTVYARYIVDWPTTHADVSVCMCVVLSAHNCSSSSRSYYY